MNVFTLFLVFGALLVSSAPSTFSTLLPKQFDSGAVQTSRYIGPSVYPGYYIYNYLQIDQSQGIPIAVFSDGRPTVGHVQPTYNYYGSPVYDYRYPFNQVFPGFPGFQPPLAVPGQPPSLIPAQVPIFAPTTQRPFDEDDGIEKLDEKLDPSLEGTAGGGDAHRNENDDEDDTVTIESNV